MALVDSPSPYVRLILNMFQVEDDVLKVEALRRLHKAVKDQSQKKDAVASGKSGSKSENSPEDILEKFCRDLCKDAAEKKIEAISVRF